MAKLLSELVFSFEFYAMSHGTKDNTDTMGLLCSALNRLVLSSVRQSIGPSNSYQSINQSINQPIVDLYSA